MKIPAAPRPATARPKMSKDILGATAQNNEPISNNAITIKLRRNVSEISGGGYHSLEPFCVDDGEKLAEREDQTRLLMKV
jgi:hypothetical protein